MAEDAKTSWEAEEANTNSPRMTNGAIDANLAALRIEWNRKNATARTTPAPAARTSSIHGDAFESAVKFDDVQRGQGRERREKQAVEDSPASAREHGEHPRRGTRESAGG